MAASLHLARYSVRGTGRMLRAMTYQRERLEATPGLAAARLFAIAELDPTFGGTPKPTRWGYFCGWETSEAREEFLNDEGALRPLTRDALEAWSVSLDTVRVVQGDWQGWRPSTEGTPALDRDEPVAVMTYGKLKARYMPAFTWQNRKIVSAFAKNDGLIMMVGLGDHPLTRATFSLWRSKGDVVRAAYGKGTVHDPIQRHSLEVPWATNYFFARFRPAASSGTWDGADPLAAFRREFATA